MAKSKSGVLKCEELGHYLAMAVEARKAGEVDAIALCHDAVVGHVLMDQLLLGRVPRIVDLLTDVFAITDEAGVPFPERLMADLERVLSVTTDRPHIWQMEE